MKMQTNKKTLSDQMFDTAMTITKASRSASLYGKLLAIKDILKLKNLTIY